MEIFVLKLKEAFKPLYDRKDPTHRFDHSERIQDFCMKVGTALGADMKLLLSVAIIHGLKWGYDEKLEEILAEHSEKVLPLTRNASRNPQTLEEKILWDANILDAPGTIGLARAFTKGDHERQTIDETMTFIEEKMKKPLFTREGRVRAKERIE